MGSYSSSTCYEALPGKDCCVRCRCAHNQRLYVYFTSRKCSSGSLRKKVAGTARQGHRRSCSKHQETSFVDQRKQCSGRDCHRDPSVLRLVRQLQGVGQVHVTHWWKDHRRWNGRRHIMMQPNRLCPGTFVTLKGACGKTTTTK